MIQSAGLPAVHLSQNSHGNGEKQWLLGRIWGSRHPQDRMHFRDPFRRRGEEIADLGGDIFACEIGVPIDSVLAADVAGIDVSELHFLYSEAGTGDDVGLDGEIVQMFGFNPGARLNLGKPPSSTRKTFEYVGSDEDAIKGKCGLEDRGHVWIGHQNSCALHGFGVSIRPFRNENPARNEQPCGNAYIGPDREYRTGLGF